MTDSRAAALARECPECGWDEARRFFPPPLGYYGWRATVRGVEPIISADPWPPPIPSFWSRFLTWFRCRLPFPS